MALVTLAEALVIPQPLQLIITHGLSGCGKTTASSRLLQSDGHARTVRLRSDTERKRLFGLTGTARSDSDTGGGIYTRGAGVRTYRRLFELAEMLLGAGWSVIVDATFLKRADRELFRALAQQAGAAFSILAPEATAEQLRERILARQLQGQDASEATLDVLSRQLRVIEPLTPQERARTFTPGGNCG
jgi:predicted kinase